MKRPALSAGAGLRPPVSLQRVRVRLAREGEAAYLSHLQQIEAIRRAFAGSGWPLAMSQGKKPRPKMSFGPAISVGYASDAEYVDVEMAARLEPDRARELLAPRLPAGYRVVQVKSIPRFFPSLEQALNLGVYRVRSPLLRDSASAWENFWRQERWPVVKKKENQDVVVDARACVREWRLEGEDVTLHVRFGPGRTLKPERIVQNVCGLTPEQSDVSLSGSPVSVRRLELYFEKENGELVLP